MPVAIAPFLPFLKGLWRVLTIMVPVPLALLAAAFLWVHFDKASAVRVAVDRAVKDLVAGAEIEAARATAEAERMMRLAAEGRNAALQTANANFAARLAEAEIERENLDDQIAELLARPVDGACLVDGDLAGRMRNR